jgi:hypothetical protein
MRILAAGSTGCLDMRYSGTTERWFVRAVVPGELDLQPGTCD